MRTGGQREVWGKKHHCQFSLVTFHPEKTGNQLAALGTVLFKKEQGFILANMNTSEKRIIEKTLEGSAKRKIL